MQFCKELKEENLSNNRFWRNISDSIDQKLGWKEEEKHSSSLRGFMHGSYHMMIAGFKGFFLNFPGMKR